MKMKEIGPTGGHTSLASNPLGSANVYCNVAIIQSRSFMVQLNYEVQLGHHSTKVSWRCFVGITLINLTLTLQRGAIHPRNQKNDSAPVTDE